MKQNPKVAMIMMLKPKLFFADLSRKCAVS
jgi:ABC-type Fe3+-citrate transport system substrate-binding protein